jgi:hypothetical protein
MTGYTSFFDQSAEIAGTLIGLLFVAISLSPHDWQGGNPPFAFRVQTAIAFNALVDALVVSLAALLPGDSAGTIAMAASVIGLSTTGGLAFLGTRRGLGRCHLRELVTLPLAATAYLVQFTGSSGLLGGAAGHGDLRVQAFLVIAFFLIAIARAWQLIGGRGSRLPGVIAETVSQRGTSSASERR